MYFKRYYLYICGVMNKNIQFNLVSEELIIQRLQFENPWWTSGQPAEFFAPFEKRLQFSGFQELVEETTIRRAVILMGPRRVGKTVLMHQSIGNLLNQKIPPNQIFYISIENPIYNYRGLEELFHLSLKASGNKDPKGCFLFFDEIQYLKDWEIHLKSLVDSYPYTKFIVSGSASAALKLKSMESGAGRFTDFKLPPLSFREYLALLRLDHLVEKVNNGNPVFPISEFTSPNIQELNSQFINYINFGGYPEVIFNKIIQSDPGRYIKSDIIDKVLLRDLPGLYGIRDVQELNSFFTTLAYNSGNELSLESLSSTSGVDKNLLKRYLEYLEASFLIRILNRVDDTGKKFRRATFYKIYLTNPSLRSALFTPASPVDDSFGNMVETAIMSQLFYKDEIRPYYARWSQGKSNGEVDLVLLDELKLKPKYAVEIKWSNRYFEKPSELKSLSFFCKKNNLHSALVTTIDKTGKKESGELNLNFIPASLLAYSVSL